MTAGPGPSFAVLLRRLRKAAYLTQEGLADAAQLSSRAVSDLERGLTRTTRKDTASRLASALGLTGPAREDFVALALGRGPARGVGPVPSGGGTGTGDAAFSGEPREWLARIVATLDELGVAAARSAVADWQDRGSADAAWLAWVDALITLTAEGRLQAVAGRPLPPAGGSPFLDREQQVAELDDFLDRIEHGRGGCALVAGPAGIGKSRLLVRVLAGRLEHVQAEWMTFDRGEAGYHGWRRLLAPLWITLRRAELAPASLLTHAAILDSILLAGAGNELARQRFPGEVAAAVAAMLVHLARRQPLVLVLDDAHRGGASSDRLLLDVTRLASAHGVGLVAALRPEELEEDSVLADYCDQAAGRAAADIVTTIRVPPLDRETTADLLRERTSVQPPPQVVELVLRQTGGSPQLINSTQLQVPPDGAEAAAWAVGKLDAEGLRVLESTIQARPESARTVLQAAALCAVDADIEPDVIAAVANLDADLVERILDEERRHGSVLIPRIPGYRFQHDNWIDALIDTCPPARRRTVHARRLELLLADPSADPRLLARHAIGAGAALVGPKKLVRLVRQAADLALADYAFASAAELYEVAARHANGAERIDMLIMRSDALRFRGRWDEAHDALKHAASLARSLAIPSREAMALIHLERLTWRYGLYEKELAQQIRDVIGRLPADQHVLRAQAQAVLTARLSISTRQYENEQADLARTLLRQLPSVADPLARADMILGIRAGLQDIAPPGDLLDLDQQAFDLALSLRSAYHLEEALGGRVTDLIRGGRLAELPSAIRAYRDFAEQSDTTVSRYTTELLQAMLTLARGDFDAASEHTSEAARLSGSWGESMAREALMGQVGWLLYETGQVDGLTEALADLVQKSVSAQNDPVWSLAAGLIHAEKGETAQAIRLLREVSAISGEFGGLPRGPSRIAVLATAAMVLGHPALDTLLPPEEAGRLGERVAGLLIEHQDALVVAGWPAVLLGSKHRYTGLAYLAAGQSATATVHLTRAVNENSDFQVLHTRTRFDLARALARQPARRDGAVAELERVEHKAAELKLAGLAAQAAAERDRWSGPAH
jgi:tetratricopeptide (TPR) repeat protein/DNA-binding XRE family transcriptional regulator